MWLHPAMISLHPCQKKRRDDDVWVGREGGTGSKKRPKEKSRKKGKRDPGGYVVGKVTTWKGGRGEGGYSKLD